MEIVKQYLEKRIEQLKIQVDDLEKEIDFEPEDQNDRLFRGDCIRGIAKFNLLKEEIEQILTLFNEEYEKMDKKIDSLLDRVEYLNKKFPPNQTI